jgi:TonB family protein
LAVRALLTVTAVATLCACAAGQGASPGAHAAAPRPSSLASAGCIAGSTDGYPEEARAQGLWGIATVSFGIDQKGRADQPQVLTADSKSFSATALQILQHMQCKAADTPAGLALQRHTAEIQFLIYPPCKALPKSVQAEDVLFVVCGSVLRGTQPKRATPDK